MDDLLIKYLLGEASAEEIARVERWLAEDTANKARYEQFRMVWKISRRTAASAPKDVGVAWQQVRQKLRSGNEKTGGARPGRVGVGRMQASVGQRKVGVGRMQVRVGRMQVGAGRMAAVVVGILLLGAGLYFVLIPRKPVRNTVAVAAAPGRPQGGVPLTPPGGVPRQMSLESSGNGQFFVAGEAPRADTLPDRSVVTVNRGSSLRVAGAADRGLLVQLQGEAFFKVVHDPSRPFVVEVNGLTIKVLGTSFEVKGIAGGAASTELVVETGAVRVCRGDDSLVLHAGERMTIAGKERWRKEANRDKLYGYYLGRPLVCDSVLLRRLVEVLNEAYDAHVIIGRPELGDLPLTTVFRQEPLDRILAVLAATFDLSVVRQGRTIILQ